MDVLIVIALGAVAARLWYRLGKVERRLDDLEAFEFAPSQSTSVQQPTAAFVSDEPEPIGPSLAFQVMQALPIPSVEPSPVMSTDSPDTESKEHDSFVENASSAFGFEDIFGRKLPIWAGGATLAIAGMLIVKYSIDAGLVSPLVRVISGLIFGSALIAAAEVALRADDRVRDPRVRQALAGAGIASLYGAVLIAANVYGLIGSGVAFVAMAAITALAMGLSLRFGAPSALLGLVGGLAAPALIRSGEPHIPLLASYLALAVGALSLLSRKQRWIWLGIAALTGGFGWAAVMLFIGRLDPISSIALALYIMLLGVVLPTTTSEPLGTAVRITGGLVAVAQIAALVAAGGFTLLDWGLFGLISAAILWLASRDEKLARVPAAGLGIALMLLVDWPSPTAPGLTLVILVGAALYGGPALRALWGDRGSVLEAAELTAIGLGGLIAPVVHFHRPDGSNDLALAAVGLAASLVPAGAAALGWTHPTRRNDARFAILTISAALLIDAAAGFGFASWALAPTTAILSAALLRLSLRSEDRRIELGAWAFAAAGVAFLQLGTGANAELSRLAGFMQTVDTPVAFLRWAIVSAGLSVLAWQALSIEGRRIAQAFSALIGYGAIAQLVGDNTLALGSAATIAALACWSRRLQQDKLLPAMAMLLTLSSLWAVAPLLQWLMPGVASLAGEPMLVTNLPGLEPALLRLLVPALLIALGARLAGVSIDRRARNAALAVACTMGAVGFHVAFKQVFSIRIPSEFVQFGLGERITWEALLFAAAVLAWIGQRPRIAFVLSATGLAHFAYYTLALHNPLWWPQAVGRFPIVNLLLPAYGLPLLWLWELRRRAGIRPGLRRVFVDGPMLLIFLFAFSSLRQLFHGSILTSPGLGEWEDICRSIVALALALGFLLRGIYRGLRDWRMASLGIMIAAVAKVFLLDASGLEGLLRIASFIALGFSLIGIGWLYSRFLGKDLPRTAVAA